MLIRSASGLRGIAEDHFTPELIDNYISAFISTQNIKSCVIGRDGRPSGKQISQWVATGGDHCAFSISRKGATACIANPAIRHQNLKKPVTLNRNVKRVSGVNQATLRMQFTGAQKASTSTN